MRSSLSSMLVVAAAGLSLAACSVTGGTGDMFSGKRGSDEARATLPPPMSSAGETTGSIGPRRNGGVPAAETAVHTPLIAAPVVPGADGQDDVARGREQFHAGNYAEAASSFDRAAKMNPRDAEAWLGLAACYDRMRRFELADRAYIQAQSIKGPTSEVLNNQGFSYLLRGDLQRARSTLTAARQKDPGNPYVQNNLKLLDSKERSGKSQ